MNGRVDGFNDWLRRAARDGDRAFVADFNTRIAHDERVERIAESLEEIIHGGYDLGNPTSGRSSQVAQDPGDRVVVARLRAWTGSA